MIQKIKCLFGFHKWRTVKSTPCKAKIGGSLICPGTFKVDAEAKLQECTAPGCNYVRGVIDSGFTEQVVGYEFLRRQMA